MVPEDTPVPEEADNQGDTLFSFWNETSNSTAEANNAALKVAYEVTRILTPTLTLTTI